MGCTVNRNLRLESPLPRSSHRMTRRGPGAYTFAISRVASSYWANFFLLLQVRSTWKEYCRGSPAKCTWARSCHRWDKLSLQYSFQMPQLCYVSLSWSVVKRALLIFTAVLIWYYCLLMTMCSCLQTAVLRISEINKFCARCEPHSFPIKDVISYALE